MKLWEIGSELTALGELLEETGGEITPEAEAVLNQWLDEMGDAQQQKLDAYVYLVKKFEHEGDTAFKVSSEFKSKAEARWKAEQRLKQRLFDYLKATGQKELPTASGWKISIQRNGGKLPLCVDQERVPQEYLELVPKIDNDKIRGALEQGKKLDFARFGKRGEQLRIR